MQMNECCLLLDALLAVACSVEIFVHPAFKPSATAVGFWHAFGAI
jgi:hypothetical protein